MKTLNIILILLFGFHFIGFGQDTIIRKDIGPKAIAFGKLTGIHYNAAIIYIANRHFTQTLNFTAEEFKILDTLILRDTSTYKINDTDINLKVYNSINLNVTGQSIKYLTMNLLNCKSINIQDVSIDKFFVYNRYNDPKFPEDTIIPNFKIQNGTFEHFSLMKSANNFTIDSSKIHNMLVTYSNLKNTFILKNSKIDTIEFLSSTLPDTSIFKNLDLTNMTGFIDLTKLVIPENSDKLLILGNIDFSKFKIPFTKCTIVIDAESDYEDQITLYQTVINKLKVLGLNKKAEVLDKKYQEIQYLQKGKYVINIVSKYWWDYGYNKGLIFTNSCVLFFIFFIINLSLFDKLIEVYIPDNIKIYYNNLNRNSHNTNTLKTTIVKTPIVLLYTAFIFWGFKLDLKEIKIKNWFSISLIILEYTIGIICLAYLANYIISK